MALTRAARTRRRRRAARVLARHRALAHPWDEDPDGLDCRLCRALRRWIVARVVDVEVRAVASDGRPVL